MKVTLSYFVDPNPARNGWKNRHRYASHHLRFAIKRPLERTDQLWKRINALALGEGEKRPKAAKDDQWLLGERKRDRGSLHADVWTGPAAELADRGAVVVYPVGGWWKEQKRHDRSAEGVRYALIVSVETPEVPADLWTPVALELGVPIEIAT